MEPCKTIKNFDLTHIKNIPNNTIRLDQQYNPLIFYKYIGSTKIWHKYKDIFHIKELSVNKIPLTIHITHCPAQGAQALVSTYNLNIIINELVNMIQITIYIVPFVQKKFLFKFMDFTWRLKFNK